MSTLLTPTKLPVMYRACQFLLLTTLLCTCGLAQKEAAVITTTKWQLITLDFTGPETSETAAENPFTAYALDVTFTHEASGSKMTVPGYYAADGNAAETSAEAGNVWRVNFRPGERGSWSYTATMSGYDGLERASGTIEVGPAAEGETGRLVRTHPRYLQWAENGEYFIKGGAGSPENLLAYADFDNTYRHSNEFRDGESKVEDLHEYRDHIEDAPSGAATWGDGKGRGLLGALQYLHGRGLNSVYFLTNNINGDGKDVFPYRHHDTLDRFDVSKLAQWERVFQHADDLGMMLHFVTQETENELLLDNGDTGRLRKLYYRELIARFGHHRAVTWDMGEENGPNGWSEGGQNNDQQRAMARYFEATDPYKNHTVFHTHPSAKETHEMYRPLFGDKAIDGLAVQLGSPYTAYDFTREYIKETAGAGQPWVVSIDEVGPWWRGIDPDAGFSPLGGEINNQDSLRALTLWGNLMAGGAGVEWYFGGMSATNDLNTESWRAYENAWNFTGYALQFFRQLPFHEMEPMPDLVSGEAMCFAKPGETYAVYLPFGRATTLDLGGDAGAVTVSWFNPREGGALSGRTTVGNGGEIRLEAPGEGDWAAVITRAK